MATIRSSDIASWERHYRTNFINGLVGIRSVCLIGTVDEVGRTNLGVFSSIVHLGSDPPLIGHIDRPRQAASHTLANIEATGSYTINHIHPSFVQKAHQCSAKYPDNVSEFEEVGSTPEFHEHNAAPFVKESRIKYALTLQEVIPIELNGTFLVIGKVNSVHIEQELITSEGLIQLQNAGSICGNGVDGYCTVGSFERYAYAKPGIHPLKIE